MKNKFWVSAFVCLVLFTHKASAVPHFNFECVKNDQNNYQVMLEIDPLYSIQKIQTQFEFNHKTITRDFETSYSDQKLVFLSPDKVNEVTVFFKDNATSDVASFTEELVCRDEPVFTNQTINVDQRAFAPESTKKQTFAPKEVFNKSRKKKSDAGNPTEFKELDSTEDYDFSEDIEVI